MPPVKDQSASARRHNGRLGASILLLVMLLALGLRCHRLNAQSLWNDEGTSVALAQRDLITITRDASRDIHPPLYYWMLSGWVRVLGTAEWAVRSLSALLGVVLVSLIYALGRELAGRRVGVAAALLAAIHPFQVYYAQEARMYMLLAVLTAAAMLALIRFPGRASTPSFMPLVALILTETAGLYTHYSFAFVIVILNVSAVLWWALSRRLLTAPWRAMKWWGISQVCVVLLYLPWLPIAIQRVTSWPSPRRSAVGFSAVVETWRWLLLGPTVETAEVVVALVAAAFLVVIGLLVLGASHDLPARQGQWLACTWFLWVFLPVVLMFALGLYQEAYLKFLLVTAPATTTLMGIGLLLTPSTAGRGTLRALTRRLLRQDRGGLSDPHSKENALRRPSVVPCLARYALRGGQWVALAFVIAASAVTLRNAYLVPAYARDNYRDLAAYVDAVGGTGDAILLNAPGQQEVFGYYYSELSGDLPIYPLPESRPLVPEETVAALEKLSQPGGRVFAVFWATDESDPNRLIEGWLDSHAYKALDSWYGNVRLVVYAIPEETPSRPDFLFDIPLRDPVTGDEIILQGYSQPHDRLAAGDIGQFTLFWRVDHTPSRRYKVFLHVLDKQNHIVGQRDAEPGGGVQLTTLWIPGETIADNYGVPIHPATPPGEYRVELGMYDLETSQRLFAPDDTTQIWLEPLPLDRPLAVAPRAALGMQHAAEAVLGELTLLGYDAHKLGFDHQPDTPLSPGDMLHINLYWRAEAQPTGNWQISIDLVGTEGQPYTGLVADPVAGYPSSMWQAGDIWRGQFNLTIPGTVEPGRCRIRVRASAPGDHAPSDAFFSDPIPIGP